MNAAAEAQRARRSSRRSRVLGYVFVSLGVTFLAIFLVAGLAFGSWMSTVPASALVMVSSGLLSFGSATISDSTAERWQRLADAYGARP